MSQEEFEEWSRSLWDLIADGGVWAVPRSGLIFRKTGPARMTLIARMPHEPEMPMSADALREYQDEEYESIKFQFGRVGVEVDAEI